MKTILLAVVLFYLTPLAAQETVKVSLKEVADRSEKIVYGVVIDQYAAWDEPRKEIYTYTTLAVDRSIKSTENDAVIKMRHLGGKVGDIESHVAGLPTFSKGEHVVVFLGPYPYSDYYGLIDWVYGRYGVAEKSNKKWVQGAEIEKMPLDTFIRKIHAFLK